MHACYILSPPSFWTLFCWCGRLPEPPHILSASLRIFPSFSYDLYSLYTLLGVSETANAWSCPEDGDSVGLGVALALWIYKRCSSGSESLLLTGLPLRPHTLACSQPAHPTSCNTDLSLSSLPLFYSFSVLEPETESFPLPSLKIHPDI